MVACVGYTTTHHSPVLPAAVCIERFNELNMTSSTVKEEGRECKRLFARISLVRCIRCKGPFHPSTGDYDHVHGVATCGACVRSFYEWLRGHVRRRWGKLDFYEHAATSIRAA